MKFLFCGDQHITSKKPKHRTDDYFRTVLCKFQQEIDIAVEEGCSVILFPGDVFDSFKENHLVVQEIIYKMKKFVNYHNGYIYAVPGQHDQQYHNSDLAGTPIQTLQAAGIISILGKEPTPITNGISLYGAGWNEEIPEVTTPNNLNILVIHKMILADEKLWEAQEGGTWSNHLLLKTKFDVIVSGDNHQQFVVSKKKRHIVNLGSMMRSTVAQGNHHPAVVVYDSETKEIEIIDLDVKPFAEVMCIEKAEKEKDRNLKLESFVHSLKNEQDPDIKEGHAIKLDFVSNLKTYIVDNKIEKNVSKIILDLLEN